MNDFRRSINNIIVKNLPKDYTEKQLEELFSKFGHIVSSKILPTNPNVECSCGLINFTEVESCTKAIETMNNYVVDQYTLFVTHSSIQMSNNFDQLQNESRVNDETKTEDNNTSLVSIYNPSNNFQSTNTYSLTTLSKISNDTSFNTNESESFLNSNKVLLNSTNIEQQNNKNPFQNKRIINIREHDSLITNKNYSVYLSNIEAPNIIFVVTSDDYINSTLLLTKMNKRDELLKVQANFYKSNLTVGAFCAALFNGDWYRARVLAINKNCVQVQFIDWGNIAWCDSFVQIRPLLHEYFEDPVLCIKCVLDGIPIEKNLSDEQINAILDILVFDVTLELIVIRTENDLSCIKLNLGQRNFNTEICSILVQLSSIPTIVENISEIVTETDIEQKQVANVSKNTPETRKIKSKIFHNIDVHVTFSEDKITYTTIGTDSLSSCIFLLLTGRIKNQQFAYLSHYPEDFGTSYTPETTMTHIIERLRSRLEYHVKRQQPLLASVVKQLTDLHLIIGGGTNEDNYFIHKGLNLLNHQNNLQDLFDVTVTKYLCQQLQFNITILKPVTFLVSDSDESREFYLRQPRNQFDNNDDNDDEDKDFEDVEDIGNVEDDENVKDIQDDQDVGDVDGAPDEPGLSLTYNCCTKTVNLYIEWISESNSCLICSLTIDFNQMNYYTNSNWILNSLDINCMKKKLRFERNEFKKFQQTLNFINNTIFIHNYNPFYAIAASSSFKNQASSIRKVSLSSKKDVDISSLELLEKERHDLEKLNENLRKKVNEQDDAIDKVVEIIQRNQTNLFRENNKPIQSFLFLGSATGVEKTTLAKALASKVFNSSESIIYINMNKYNESDSINRLIDTLSDDLIFEETGELIEAIQQSNSVILFDEIERAHPVILNILLLKILNFGQLPNGRNQTIDFKNSIIILTSNVGTQDNCENNQDSSLTTKSFYENLSQIKKDSVIEQISSRFPSELLQHLDNIVFFAPLD